MPTSTRKNGITLIALIITIIVMIILVGVTINVSLNGGLFKKTKIASDETQKQVSKEQLISAMVGAYNNNGNFVANDVVLPEGATWCTEEDTDYETALEAQTAERNWVITKNNNKFYIDSNGAVLDKKPEENIEYYVKNYEGEEVVWAVDYTNKTLTLWEGETGAEELEFVLKIQLYDIIVNEDFEINVPDNENNYFKLQTVTGGAGFVEDEDEGVSDYVINGKFIEGNNENEFGILWFEEREDLVYYLVTGDNLTSLKARLGN